MFFPSVDEKSFGAPDTMIDEINSAFECIDEVLLGNSDTTPEDEDDDEPDFYQPVKTEKSCYQQTNTTFFAVSAVNQQKSFATYKQSKIFTVTGDVISPPPDL